MIAKSPTLHVFKIERDDTTHKELTRERVISNAKRGISTGVLLDVNIVYAIRDVFLRNVSLDESGLNQFRDMLNSTLAGVVLSSAYQEVTHGIRNECRDMVNVFLSEFCNRPIDHSSSHLNLDSGDGSFVFKHDSGFAVEKIDLLLPYYYISKINQLWLELRDKPRIEIYKRFLNDVISEIDLVSAMDAEIAGYCFCNDQETSKGQSGYSNDAASKIAVIRKNFLGITKKTKTLSGRLSTIHNSVRDIGYINTTRFLDVQTVRKGELWVATFDGKLAEVAKHFCTLSYEGLQKLHPIMALAPQMKNEVGIIERPYGINKQDYWQSVDEMNFKMYHERKDKDRGPVGDEFFENIKICISNNIDSICSHY